MHLETNLGLLIYRGKMYLRPPMSVYISILKPFCFGDETRKCERQLKYLEIGGSVIKKSDSWKEAT